MSRSSAISPAASISTFFVKSPSATAVVAMAIDRTWLVNRSTMVFTLRRSPDEREALADAEERLPVREVPPFPADADDLGGTAQLAFEADLPGDPTPEPSVRPKRPAKWCWIARTLSLPTRTSGASQPFR